MRKGFAIPDLQNTLVGEVGAVVFVAPGPMCSVMTERGGRYLKITWSRRSRSAAYPNLAGAAALRGGAFNPQAMSAARASGMWQFMPATGKDFDLKQNLFRDDRRDAGVDPCRADHLQMLYGQFGRLAAGAGGLATGARATASGRWTRNLKAGLPAT